MKKRKIGRTPYKPSSSDDELVLKLSVMGLKQEQIAEVLDIAPKTLRKYYREVLDKAAIKANAAVVEGLYKNATENENVTAQIWWTKCRLGWKETQQIETMNYHFVDTPKEESREEWLKNRTIEIEID